VRITRARIEELKSDSETDEVTASSESEHDLIRYLQKTKPAVRPFITLCDNGNFRVVWKDDSNNQVGLQFIGGGGVHYVLLVRSSDDSRMIRVTGNDHFDGVASIIAENGLLVRSSDDSRMINDPGMSYE